MNATLPLCLAQVPAPFVPAQSVVRQIIQVPELTEDQRQQIDEAMHADKLRDGYGQRNYQSALALQIQHNPEQWRAA